jgi:hypothetical protein
MSSIRSDLVVITDIIFYINICKNIYVDSIASGVVD